MSWRDHIHPAADLFPMMSEPELRQLGEDIKKNGLRTPILKLHSRWAGRGFQPQNFPRENLASKSADIDELVAWVNRGADYLQMRYGDHPLLAAGKALRHALRAA